MGQNLNSQLSVSYPERKISVDQRLSASQYEVVSLLVMIGKRGCLSREKYQEHYGEADELAAMIAGAIKSTYERG